MKEIIKINQEILIEDRDLEVFHRIIGINKRNIIKVKEADPRRNINPTKRNNISNTNQKDKGLLLVHEKENSNNQEKIVNEIKKKLRDKELELLFKDQDVINQHY